MTETFAHLILKDQLFHLLPTTPQMGDSDNDNIIAYHVYKTLVDSFMHIN